MGLRNINFWGICGNHDFGHNNLLKMTQNRIFMAKMFIRNFDISEIFQFY